MIALDASVWLSTLLTDDVHHMLSEAWLQKWMQEGGRIVVPAIFLPEVSGALARRSGSTERGYRAINDLISNPLLHVHHGDDDLAEAAGAIAATHRLRGADAVYVALAAHLDVPLVTWDREQIERTTGAVSALTLETMPPRAQPTDA